MAASARVVLVSDTHGELDERIAREAMRGDVVVHAGDIGARAVLDALKPPTGELVAVRGNNDVRDKWPPSEWDFLDSLPWEARVELPGGVLALVHGHRYGTPGRSHDRMRRDYADARLVVYGHSHLRCEDQTGSPWVVNPGVAGRVRTFGGPSFCVLHASRDGWHLDAVRFPDAEKRAAPGKQRTSARR